MATTEDLAESPAASGDVDDVVKDGQIDGGITTTDSDDGGSRGINYRIGQR